MKKTKKPAQQISKLRLSREAIRLLGSTQMAAIAGGLLRKDTCDMATCRSQTQER